MPNYLETRSLPWRKAKETNATDTSFPSRPTRITRPSNDGVHACGTYPGIVIVPYGTGDNNDVFEMHVLLWRSLGVFPATVWLPNRATTAFVCTLSTFAGPAGGILTTTDLVCDTITTADTAITTQSINASIVSPADNTPAYIVLNTFGAEMIEFIFDATTGDPTGMNCLWAPL